MLAIDGTDLNEPTPLEQHAPRRWRRAAATTSGSRCRSRQSSWRSRTPRRRSRSVPTAQAGPPAADAAACDFDAARLRAAGADAVRRRAAGSTAAFVLEVGRKLGFFDGRPGHAMGDQRRHLPGRADLRRGGGRPRQGDDLERHGRRCTRCTSTVTTLLVLSRDGVRRSRAVPWWTDTLDVESGERFEVAFRADNPGLWMDHCHNLKHAAEGLTHARRLRGHRGRRSAIGGDAHNHPE